MQPKYTEMLDIVSELNEQNYLFFTILDHFPDPTFAIDTKGKVTIWNKAIEKLTGIETGSIIGKDNFEHSYCLYGERKPFFVDLLIENLLQLSSIPEIDLQHEKHTKDSCLYEETTCIDSKGQKYLFQVKTTPLYCSQGSLIGAIASMKQITAARGIIKKTKPGDRVKISRAMREKIIASLQKLLEEKSEETVEHAFRINNYAAEIGKAIGLLPAELQELTLLAALHDLGKIAIPDSIILKTERLTMEEWEIMKKHSDIGFNMTQSIPELAHVSEKILHHHEWWNGKGYPDGLAGEEIPLLSRIIAVVDAYDVMISGRAYKKSLPPQEVLQELLKYSGIHFEPRLVDIFINIRQNEIPTINPLS